MKLRNWIIQLALMGNLLWLGACDRSTGYQKAVEQPRLYHGAVQRLTDAIVYDIFSPPVASRVYAYPSIAAYEVLVQHHPGYRSLAGQLHGLTPVPAPTDTTHLNYSLAALHAFTLVGQKLVFSEEKLEAYRQETYSALEAQGLPADVKEKSLAYGQQVAEHILEWSKKDRYSETRSMPKYSVREETRAWKPTPPDYMDGIEPHWNKIRTFVIDSAQQFKPAPPTPFSMEEGSPFYQELMEVYETGINLTEEQEAIAQFWDCNPYVSHHSGHVMFATKKITPGGHWIGITGQACRQADADMMQTVEAYARVSISLADAFISCWDEKWRSILVRPETLINEHIDKDWVPLLQTPPFPEHTSGHSVISSSAAVTLTGLFGDNFAFADSTELRYGLPVREFDSFMDASSEAAISRLYGGIHYMPAIRDGVKQGKQIGQFIEQHLYTRQEDAVAEKGR